MTQFSWRFWTVMGILAGTLLLSKVGEARKPDVLATPLESLPLNLEGWAGTNLPKLTDSVEARLLATGYLTRVYRRGNREMSLLVSYYAQQRAGESMHSPKVCLPGAGWEPWDYSVAYVPVEGQRIAVNRYAVQKGGQRRQVLYWYQSRRRIVASEYSGKVMLLWDALRGNTTGGSLVRLMTADLPGAVEDEIQFATHLIPEMQKVLGR